MKKFAFLLAIVAVFAMSASAFATDGDVSAIAAYDGFTTNAVNNEVGSSGSDWTVQAFYYGTVQNLMIGTKLTVDGASAANATRYGAKVGTAAVVFNDAAPAVNLTSAENVRFNMPFSATGDMVIGAYTASGTDAIAATKTLQVIPAELKVTAKDGTDDVNNKTINVKTTRAPFDIIVAGTAGPDSLDTTNLVVKSGDTAVPTGTGGLAQWSSSTGKIAIDPTRAKAGDTLTITVKAPETDSAKVLKTATGTQVAGVTSTTVFATISIKFVDYIVEPATAAWDGSTASAGVTFTVKELTADKLSKIEIKGSGVGPEVLDPANYTATTKGSDVEIELKLEYLEGLSKNDYTFTITDDANKTADFVLAVTPKGEGYYTADPPSATWDGGTTGVKFTVDMAHSDFNAIGLKRPDDEDVRELGKDYYTVTPTADGIEIELKPEWLSTLTEAGDYVYYVGDLKGKSALFTLTVTGQGGVTVPLKGAYPSFGSGEGPEGVEFGISQRVMRSDEITALDERIGDFLDENGMIKKEEAASLIGVDEDALTILPTVGTTLSGGKTIAAITFGVTGLALVSEEVEGIRWYDAIIHKMYVGRYGPASVRLAPARTWGAIANGTYMILNERDELLAEDYVIAPDSTRYKLVVYVQDGGDYDLDYRTELHVVDPVSIQKSSGRSSSSSGGCDAGAGLVALAGLAAIALRKRGK